ncbi:MAG: sensor histidine kinase, partial [Gemmatimonadaceae bacterium]
LIALALDNARLRAEADRRRRIAEQRAYDRLQFLARINHELRTPLQSITGYIQLLQSDTEGTTSRQRDMLTRIERSEQVLLAIIDDVANLGRLEAGRMTYALGGVTVADVMDRVDSVIAPLAGRQGVSVRFEMPPKDLQAHADRIKLTQVLINLVTNAVKFTPAGGVVRVQTRQLGSRIDLVVRDQGPGIPPDKLAAIFDPYVQLDNRRESPFTGFGLGLAISREFAVGMGGRLVAENAPPPERGAIFTFTLRVHRPDRRAWRSRAEPLPANPALGVRSAAGPSPTTP